MSLIKIDLQEEEYNVGFVWGLLSLINCSHLTDGVQKTLDTQIWRNTGDFRGGITGLVFTIWFVVLATGEDEKTKGQTVKLAEKRAQDRILDWMVRNPMSDY